MIMDYIFFGTPEFAAIILERLFKAGRPPVLTVCNPDRPAGRKKIITVPPAKIIARKYGIPVAQPENLKDKNCLPAADFAVAAAYSLIIPEKILGMFRLGVVGVHPSLLPRYRGPSPIQSAILNGETETGVTLYLMDEKVDHGPIFAQRELELPISNFQFPILSQKLAELSGDLLEETLPKFISGRIVPAVQDEERATYTKKFKTEDGFVDLGKDAVDLVERKIRALNPEPGVWTRARENTRLCEIAKTGKRVKLLAAELIDRKLKLVKIQIEGEKPREIDLFV